MLIISRSDKRNRNNSTFSLAMPLLIAVAALILAVGVAASQEVWVGYGHIIEKPDYADWTLPENHDSITANVKLTRRDIQGMFNLAQEDSYSGANGSPIDTEWAMGRAADWESLSFTNWATWAAGSPQNTIGKNAVLHLISDDIYIDIYFISFSGGNSGGGFCYNRATPDTPAQSSTLSQLKALY